jgi:hypothetical protein
MPRGDRLSRQCRLLQGVDVPPVRDRGRRRFASAFQAERALPSAQAPLDGGVPPSIGAAMVVLSDTGPLSAVTRNAEHNTEGPPHSRP